MSILDTIKRQHYNRLFIYCCCSILLLFLDTNNNNNNSFFFCNAEQQQEVIPNLRGKGPASVVYKDGDDSSNASSVTTAATTQQQEDQCPPIIRKKVGLFNNKSKSPVKDEFKDTVLLVSSNYAYYEMLQNWEYLANEIDLKWAVLALDEELYDELGPDRALPPDHSYSVSGSWGWREAGFQKLSCNKMRMALDVATKCKVNVVFTDVDNIFFKNPFEHDLGRLIRSKKYDYLYQPNVREMEPRNNQCLLGLPKKEANTGFYYIKHDSKVYKEIIDKVLDICNDSKNKIDDQTLFWQEFWNIKQEKEEGNKIKYHHCDSIEEYENPEIYFRDNNNKNTKDEFNWCCLDPYHYPTGDNVAKRGSYNKDPITYHANFASDHKMKVKKLQYARADQHGWDESRITKKSSH